MADFSYHVIARFWSKVEVATEGDCWPWLGATSVAGYGRFRVNGKLVLSHRFAYELANGPVPPIPKDRMYHGRVVMHICDNPRCCNPAHLTTGTQRANVHDMIGKSRGNRPRGTEVPTSKLDEIKVRAIREDPRTHRKIATAYQISKSVVGAIKRREYWKHVA